MQENTVSLTGQNVSRPWATKSEITVARGPHGVCPVLSRLP